MTLRVDPAAETVRPDPGMARGVHGAPPVFFYAVLAVTLLALALWLARGRLRRLWRRSAP